MRARGRLSAWRRLAQAVLGLAARDAAEPPDLEAWEAFKDPAWWALWCALAGIDPDEAAWRLRNLPYGAYVLPPEDYSA
jgi:hypothetical protein